MLFALALLWRPFAGRVGVVFGLLAAELALAMQEVIGAFTGWISILTGRQFRVGDRIQMCGIRGDVLETCAGWRESRSSRRPAGPCASR